MAAEIFGVSHVPTWLAEIEISSMWSLVTALAELIKIVQYADYDISPDVNYCTISTKCSRFWEIFHAEMAEIFSFDLRRIKKNTWFTSVTRDAKSRSYQYSTLLHHITWQGELI